MKQWLVAWLVVILVISVIVGFAFFATYNFNSLESITIRLDSDLQKSQLINGRIPDIKFYSLQDTPYGNNIKILRVLTHYSWGEGYHTITDKLSNWLNIFGITNYSKFPIDYVED